MVHRGCNSAMSLQQLRSVFCMCFADTDEHTTQSQSPCTASQVEKKKTKNQPQSPRQAPALPPEGSARGWVVWEGKKHQGLCPPHSSSHLAAQQLTLSLFAQRRRLFPVTSPPALQSLPLCTPRSQNAPPGREMMKAGGGKLGERRHPLCPGGHLPKVNSETSIFPPPFLLSFLPSFPWLSGGS